jgi:hypothetical protein
MDQRKKRDRKNPDMGKRFFVFQNLQTGSEACPAHIQWAPGFFHGVKQPEPEFSLLSPSSAEVKMSGATILFPVYVFMVRAGKTKLCLNLCVVLRHCRYLFALF